MSNSISAAVKGKMVSQHSRLTVQDVLAQAMPPTTNVTGVGNDQTNISASPCTATSDQTSRISGIKLVHYLLTSVQVQMFYLKY